MNSTSSLASKILNVGLLAADVVVKYFSGDVRYIRIPTSRFDGNKLLKFKNALFKDMKNSCFCFLRIFKVLLPLPFFPVWVVTPSTVLAINASAGVVYFSASSSSNPKQTNKQTNGHQLLTDG